MIQDARFKIQDSRFRIHDSGGEIQVIVIAADSMFDVEIIKVTPCKNHAAGASPRSSLILNS